MAFNIDIPVTQSVQGVAVVWFGLNFAWFGALIFIHSCSEQ